MFLFKHKTDKYQILKWGVLGGLAESLYIFLIALFFGIMENKTPKDPIMASMLILTLLVISVIVSAILVFGKPFQLVFKKKQIKMAVLTFFATLVTLVVVFAIILFAIG